jgi:CheY-like chemotaxis protein
MEPEKRTILIVDSSASSIFYMASLLRELRYAVTSISSGEDALDIIARSAPTAVITDTVLPKMSGLKLLEQIKNNKSLRFIPVMINTADTSTAVREACTQAGCAGYFTKPADPEALYRAIQSASETTPRKHIRINTALKALIDARPAVGGKTGMQEVTSLSEGGLYVRTVAPMKVNALVPLTLILGDHEIQTTAVVLYSSEKIGGLHEVPGMGLKFTNISEDDLNVIRDFIRASVIRDLQARQG